MISGRILRSFAHAISFFFFFHFSTGSRCMVYANIAVLFFSRSVNVLCTCAMYVAVVLVHYISFDMNTTGDSERNFVFGKWKSRRRRRRVRVSMPPLVRFSIHMNRLCVCALLCEPSHLRPSTRPCVRVCVRFFLASSGRLFIPRSPNCEPIECIE